MNLRRKIMKALKITGIVLLSIFIFITTMFTIYFLFANEGYGIDMISQNFEDGFYYPKQQIKQKSESEVNPFVSLS